MNNIKEFLNKYQFEDIQIEHRQKFRSPYYGFNGIDKSDLEYFNSVDMLVEDVVKCKLPSKSLEEIAEIVIEWNDLYDNPESARLIHEARFINRLKRGL